MKRCDECHGEVTVDKKAVRRYDLGGLPHVELHGVHVTRCPSCGAESVGIPQIEQLHQVLATHFISQTRLLVPTESRFLRKYMGLSTLDFAKCMGVSRETVSRWENGANPMGAQNDRLVRILVASSTPISDYAAKDALCGIDASRPAPKRPARFAIKGEPERMAT